MSRVTRAPIAAPVTAADESYTHQDVAPVAATVHVDPRWAERCWHLLDLGEGWVLGAGRALWRHAGRRTAVAGLATPDTMWAVRAAAPYDAGNQDDDPDEPRVGPLRIATLEPLRHVRLTLDDDGDAGLAFDLDWQARTPPVPTTRNRIERDGRVLTDYMNYYQSGWVSGTVRAGDEERTVARRAAFRDRGWGLRHHEGAARRGMHVFLGCELPDRAVYVLLYETASGERVFTNGWVVAADGVVDVVATAEHELRLDGRRLRSGTLELVLGSGARLRVVATPHARLVMEAVGYTAVPGRGDPGRDRLDLTDPAVAAAWDGLYDNACTFDVDGVAGHGYLEVGLGVHAKYLPDGSA